jgi:hypothetical protein
MVMLVTFINPWTVESEKLEYWSVTVLFVFTSTWSIKNPKCMVKAPLYARFIAINYNLN